MLEAWRVVTFLSWPSGRSCKFVQHRESGIFNGSAIGARLRLRGIRGKRADASTGLQNANSGHDC